MIVIHDTEPHGQTARFRFKEHLQINSLVCGVGWLNFEPVFFSEHLFDSVCSPLFSSGELHSRTRVV